MSTFLEEFSVIWKENSCVWREFFGMETHEVFEHSSWVEHLDKNSINQYITTELFAHCSSCPYRW